MTRNTFKAAAILKKGGIVAFPTETVYGLGALAFDSKAVCRVFEVKKRPAFDPLIVHVASIGQALSLWKQVPKEAQILMEHFWPGPLSIVLPKNKIVPDVVTAGLPTVAVRMPAHRVALKLIKEAGSPIAAPSANLFGYTSPTTAKAVFQDMGQSIDEVLDGGSCRVGVESTVIQYEKGRWILLRPGGVPVEQIEKVLKKKIFSLKRATAVRRNSPGFLKSHYAPVAPMVMLNFSSLETLRGLFPSNFRVGALAFRKAAPASICFKSIVLSLKGDLYESASKLFQAIRKLDKMKPNLIVAEPFPVRGIGLAIMDRLTKAASSRVGLAATKKLIHKLISKRSP